METIVQLPMDLYILYLQSNYTHCKLKIKKEFETQIQIRVFSSFENSIIHMQNIVYRTE